MEDFRKYQEEAVSVLGAGSWGTTIAMVIAEANPHLSVKLWAYEKQVVRSISSAGVNAMYLPGVRLPHNVMATGNIRDCVFGCKNIILAVPSKAISETCARISKIVDPDARFGYISKGFCKVQGRVLTISETIENAIPQVRGRIVAISGPSHAEEVSRKFHTCLSVASESAEARDTFMGLLECPYLHCRGSADVKGVELGGTLKNPAAIAAGMISALPACGDNLAGALIAESLKEIIRIGRIMGAQEETLLDISGLGDLVTTALSAHSRNRRFGYEIAQRIMTKGNTLGLFDRLMLRLRPGSVLAKMGEKLDYLAEGAYAIEPLIEIAAAHGIALPVYRSLYEILLNKKEPSLLIETIKDPRRFEEIYLSTKIQVKERKRGLEHTSGIHFREMILSSFEERYRRSEPLRAEIARFVDSLITPGEDGVPRSGYARDASAGEFALLQDARKSAAAARTLCDRYLAGIVDNYSPLVRLAFAGLVQAGALLGIGKSAGNRKILCTPTDYLRKEGTPLFIIAGAGLADPLSAAVALGNEWNTMPRFPVYLDAAGGFLKKALIHRSGGYTIDRSRLVNPLYRELLYAYAGVMLVNGVSMVVPAGEDAPVGDQFARGLIAAVGEMARNASARVCIVPVHIRQGYGLMLECGRIQQAFEMTGTPADDALAGLVLSDLGVSQE
ncbi:MAG: NAD(P)H-dependent glycerol-3-phosphate dehydrogenase [Spirochaetes bacterium]|nr:MAG: NAD(P)H-dependent glycerol-3-phosphate dehydrogenase [Spirochaetota bacterium]